MLRHYQEGSARLAPELMLRMQRPKQTQNNLIARGSAFGRIVQAPGSHFADLFLPRQVDDTSNIESNT